MGGEGATFYFIFYFFVFQKLFFLKIWHSKSGYRHLRRPKSLPRMRFSSLYDASPPRNISVCVFDLDLGRKKTSLREGATKNSGHQFFFQELFFFEDLAWQKWVQAAPSSKIIA